MVRLTPTFVPVKGVVHVWAYEFPECEAHHGLLEGGLISPTLMSKVCGELPSQYVSPITMRTLLISFDEASVASHQDNSELVEAQYG
jgi:hypothetical protein